MSVVYVAGEAPGAGATAVAAGLAEAWRSAGKRVSLAKPLAEPGDPDCAFFAELGGSDSAAPAMDGDDSLRAPQAARIVRELAESADVVIIEGPPLESAAAPALADSCDAQVVGVARYGRPLGAGSVGAWRAAFGDRLAGLLVNKRTRYAEHDARERLLPEIAGAGVAAFGALPEDRLLLAPTVQQVVDCIGGVYFTAPDGSSALIENILIGGLIAEWGGNYFGRLPNQAVIVRGGRIDIQMSALNFPLNALALTGCDAPSQYVRQRADELDAPLIVVKQDTHETAAALERLNGKADARHPEKARRAAELLAAHADLTALSAAVGAA